MRFFAFILLFSSSAYAEPTTVRLTTQDQAPYGSYDANKNFDGVAVRVVKCVMEKLKRPYNLEVLPWARAQLLVKNGEADGFFAGSQSKEREEYAIMSDIIADQRWVWYMSKESKWDTKSAEFKTQAKVGSFLGGNMLDFLKKEKYNLTLIAPNMLATAKALEVNRVDAVLVNEIVMKEYMKIANIDESKYRVIVEQDKPLGVHFSKTFVKNNPDFMKKFNEKIPECRK